MVERLLVRDLAGAIRAIRIEDGIIVALDDAAMADNAGAIIVHGARLTAHPGFIDLQVNGIDGLDFTADPASIWLAGMALARRGVTSFLPTIVTSPRGTVERALEALARSDGSGGAMPLGLHVEGPFISPLRHGAHDATQVRDPDRAEVMSWATAGARIITLAPELNGSIEAIRAIAAAGAVAAIGHTDADAATTSRAIDAGARYATHLFNAMPPIHHRRPGAVGALLADERVTIGLIADGVHLDPLVLGLVARLAGTRVSLVSDVVGGSLGGRAIERDSITATVGHGVLAGGAAGLDHAVRTYASVAGSNAAIAAVTETPARLLGLDDGRGFIRVGGRADVVLLDERLQVAMTIVNGEVVHRAD